MAFSIRAELPLGTYRGHRQDRTPEPLPSPARLHAALLAAAGFGPRARRHDDGWDIGDDDALALRWLEEHPPDAVSVPAIEVSRGDAVAYREDGTFTSRQGRKVFNKPGKREGVVAVDGAFVWSWDEAPPGPIAEALRALCPDVSHLGSAESPVRLTASEHDAVTTHRRAVGVNMFSGREGHSLDVPVRGRLSELRTAHRAQAPSPTAAKDRISGNEASVSAPPPRVALRSERYLSVAPAPPDLPWPTALLVPLELEKPGEIVERDRVRWAVAAHRALIRQFDHDAPPLLTGAYPEGARRPANRVALHIVSADQPCALPGSALALAVLLPRDDGDPTYGVQVARVMDAVGALRALHPRGRGARVHGAVEERSGATFWREPAPGAVRVWRTSPPAVPDTRGRAGWTFTHAALLSVGFVWQAYLPTATGRGEARDRAVVDAVNAAGAVVLDTAPVRTSRVEDYVHRVHRDAVVRPYRARLHLGDLAPPGAVAAIGQARHLGGGLLVPDDHVDGGALADGGAR